jgi:hypothetical protein
MLRLLINDITVVKGPERKQLPWIRQFDLLREDEFGAL